MKEALLLVKSINRGDRQLILTTAFAALMLSSKAYFGSARIFEPWLNAETGTLRLQIAEYFYSGVFASLRQLLFWAGCCVLFYLLIPMLFRRIVWPDSPSLFQINIPRSHLKIYGYMLLFMVLPLIGASFLKSFQNTYPFVYIPRDTDFTKTLICWEIGYLCQFIAVEYFFRGFLLFSFEKHLGNKAVLIPLIPYVMIHFGKPFPETMGAIVAGIVLGIMALRSRSIIPGICVHFSIAISMDLLSLWQQGFF
jgi:membrane protease YdiL (CAAX protease family)